MKRLFNLFALLLCTGFFFSASANNTLPESYAKDYANTIHNETLNLDIATKFAHLISVVERVDVHYNADFGFYYVAHGSINGKSTVVMLKTTEKEVNTQTYSYIDFTNLEAGKAYLNCTSLPFSTCRPPGQLGIICGVYKDGKCYLR